MLAQQDEYETIASSVVIESLLNTMIENGGVSLCMASPEARAEPIVLMEQHVDKALVMDLSSVDYLLGRLQSGETFYLQGQTQGKVVRTPLLALTETRHSGGAFYVAVTTPRRLMCFSVANLFVLSCAWGWR